MFKFQGYSLINKSDLEIKLKTDYEVLDEKTEIYSWEALALSSTELKIQLQFEHPTYISSF
jgi:hypothetical protein